MRGLALNFASTHQTENPRGFSEVGKNKQLFIAVVVRWLCVLRCFGKQFSKIDYEQQTVIEMRGSFFFRNELDKENQEGLTQRKRK
ncbi:hypothetical protein A8C32_05290 [Flavivirga aquatica]|uniref:Uncharacterized protein n=1 Tax=Flavivirga aquatica TaxID=1849968 RepID=A0A1E5SHL7_9FLAO|nr:hypothetical protein A8C32_05290 [Flavivirga aquatica]